MSGRMVDLVGVQIGGSKLPFGQAGAHFVLRLQHCFSGRKDFSTYEADASGNSGVELINLEVELKDRRGHLKKRLGVEELN